MVLTLETPERKERLGAADSRRTTEGTQGLFPLHVKRLLIFLGGLTEHSPERLLL